MRLELPDLHNKQGLLSILFLGDTWDLSWFLLKLGWGQFDISFMIPKLHTYYIGPNSQKITKFDARGRLQLKNFH